jgi:hypothetical protein
MFVQKTFGDGDKEIHLSGWQKVTLTEQANLYANDLQRQNEQAQSIGANEPAIRHEDGVVKIEEDGSIVLFANADSGARIDATTNQLIFFGDEMHLDSQSIHLHTNQNEWLWNQKQIVEYQIPSIHCNCDCDGCKTIAGNLSNKVFLRTIPRNRTDSYDDEIKKLLQKQGITYQRRG